jgi:hypothetical protein
VIWSFACDRDPSAIVVDMARLAPLERLTTQVLTLNGSVFEEVTAGNARLQLP